MNRVKPFNGESVNLHAGGPDRHHGPVLRNPGPDATARSRFALLAAFAVDNAGTGLFLPLPILYATREAGLSLGAAGAAVAAGTVAGFAIPPLAGRLTHRRGPRFAVATALWAQGVGAAGYLVAGGMAGIVVAAVPMAAGSQTFYCSMSVLVADLSPGEDAKERPFAVVGMVRAAAFGLGNLVAALLLAAAGDGALRLLVAVDAATFALAALVLVAFVPVAHVAHDARAAAGPLRVLRDGRYRTLIVATFLLAVPLDFALVGMPVFVIDVLRGPGWLPGALLACLTVLSSVLGVRVVRALRGHRRTWSLRLCGWLYAGWSLASIGMVWLPAALLVPFAFAVWLLMVAANKVFFPVAAALSEALPPRQDRAAYMATFQYAFTTAGVLAPALVALFEVSAWLPWTVVAAAAACGVLVPHRLGAALPDHLDRPPVPAAA
jgi:MFS family permease